MPPLGTDQLKYPVEPFLAIQGRNSRSQFPGHSISVIEKDRTEPNSRKDTMNKKQLIALGVPADCVTDAVACIHAAAKAKMLRSFNPKQIIPEIVASPEAYQADDLFGPLAQSLIAFRAEDIPTEPIDFVQWGEDIDEASREQMRNACRLPMATGAALMPDAHVGYGLPIGGVLACENAVVPYAVGVDIACRMRLSITDLPVGMVQRNDASECQELDKALHSGTKFGVGKDWSRPYHHDVLDEDWTVTRVTREVKDRARNQLGTSGSGNHFAEWGIVELPENDLGIEPGQYVGLLSHSGSRGAGSKVCNHYTQVAQHAVPTRYRHDKQLRHLAWLSLDSQEGQEYWAAMNLMGQYAAANHEVIHRNVIRLSGAQVLAHVENHHNFAWKEQHGGKEVVVHRKGATPAGVGALGVIPGNMADTAFIVRGRGLAASLDSASHGAGRRMSRKAAKSQFRWQEWRDHLRKKNVRLLAGGLDEVPGAYKNIHEVMRAQSDLVDIVGTFQPAIVMMCGDGSRPED